jgi:hypothetical protein
MLAEYTITESFATDRSVCGYLYNNSIDSIMSGKSYKGTSVLVYTTSITEEDALFITLAFPDATVSKCVLQASRT